MSSIINFLSNNFEVIILVNFCFFIMAAVTIIFVRLRLSIFANIRQFSRFLNQLLFYIVVGLQSLMIMLAGYLFLINYVRASMITLEERTIYDISWVKSQMPIYYIVGQSLMSIQVNGQDEKKVFEVPYRIREYHFSPDGQFILVVTEKDIYKFNRKNGDSELIDTLSTTVTEDQKESQQPPAQSKGVIHNVRWAPDSQKFCYELVKWSKFSSQDTLYVYNLNDEKKYAIHNPTREVSALSWDMASENLYYTQFEAKDTSRYSYPYEIRIFKVPLSTLHPELVEKIPYREPHLSSLNLKLRNIKLFTQGDKLSFGRSGLKENEWSSEDGPRIGIDEDDHLYYIKNRWWRKRLYKIPSVFIKSDMPRYKYGKGVLVIYNIKWLPGGHYVVLGHRSRGILILEPSSGKVGQLVSEKGDTFGWYPGDAKNN